MNLKINIAVAQIKPRKGDYTHNLSTITEILKQVQEGQNPADVLVLPETATTGYFLEGGVRELARTNDELFEDINRAYISVSDGRPLDIVIGFYEQWERKYYNSCLYATLGNGTGPVAARIVHTHRKFFLPTYGVFDEKRFVSRGRVIDAFSTRFEGTRVAALVCEDFWHSVSSTIAALKGAQIIYVVSASPGRGFAGESVANADKWRQLLINVADEHAVWVVHCGLVGFEGGKGFVGCSSITDPFAIIRLEAPVGREALLRATLDMDDVAVARANSPLLGDLESNLADIVHEMEFIERRAYYSD